jgi:ubiquinone/menaquinone biosynthesis C-methylase UbiE
MQATIDEANASFWDELCGTGLATMLGIKDRSPESLRKFDDYYFGMYPYLLPLIKPERMAGKRVLEIGLGYGSLSQKLAEAGAKFHGLDIANNPVAMTNHRLKMAGLRGQAVTGSALEMPFPDEYFDYLVSIGCFHHTGNLQCCLDETFRVLKPGGSAVLMVYNRFSLRQWARWPEQTLKALVDEVSEILNSPDDAAPETLALKAKLVDLFGFLAMANGEGAVLAAQFRALAAELAAGLAGGALSADRRAAYDTNAAGEAAPETALSSVWSLRRMLKNFESVTFCKQNADPLIAHGALLVDRPKLLPSVGRLLGLDIYFEARKGLVGDVRHAA